MAFTQITYSYSAAFIGVSAVSLISVISICPGLWVMHSGKLALKIATCGVTPQAQKTATSSSLTGLGSPQSGTVMS